MKSRYGEITKEILLTVALTGMIVVASTSPYFLTNIARSIMKNKKYGEKKATERKIARSLMRLREKRLIIIQEKEDGNFVVKATVGGKKVIEEINIENLEIKKQSVWDKKWRMVAFDIPDHRKNARDALREKLKELKFYQFQKSLFICPYPCEREIQFLCEFFDITSFVNIIIAEKIHNDIKVRARFNIL